MLARIFGPTPEMAASVPPTLWWAIVYGANLGGNLTPIGSASTVVAVSILRKHGLGVSFLDFVKFGLAFAGAQLALASLYLLLLGRVL
jgi:Na+/H+ antiporter NhaD/arsenite permease-like protein